MTVAESSSRERLVFTVIWRLRMAPPTATAKSTRWLCKSRLPTGTHGDATCYLSIQKEIQMSIEGKAKEAAGFVKEELNEHGKSAENQKKAQEGRDLRNEGRVEDGKAPKTTKPGTGH
jgi:hypothetical protein